VSAKKTIFWAIAVTSLVAISLRAANLGLTWSHSPDPRTVGYNVWFAVSRGPYTVTNVGYRTACTLTQLIPGDTYYIMVAAVDQYGVSSPFGNQLAFTMPPLPEFETPSSSVVFTPSGVTITPGASVTVAPGANVNFTATASGVGPLTYSWNIGKRALSGATSTSVSLTNVSAANAGTYTLVVTGFSGSVTSSPMTLTVLPMASGTYNGLFYQAGNNGTANVTVDSAGMLANCAVSAQGVYSAKVCVGDAGYLLMGTFDIYGNSESVVSRASSGQPNLDVQLHLNWALPAGQLTGTVSNMSLTAPWMSTLQADSSSSTALLPALVDAELISRTNVSSYGQLSFASLLGQVFVSGLLSDGSMFTENVPISSAARVPVCASLYAGQGLFEGWVSLSNGVPSGTVTWVQRAAVTGSSRPGGFTNVLVAIPMPP
jgi:hypothetical protein